MDVHSSLYDCYYESIFHETRKDDFLALFKEKKTDRERIQCVLSLPTASNLKIPDSFEGKSTLLSDSLLEEAISTGKTPELYTMAILKAPDSSTAMASGYVARAEALLSNGYPHLAKSDAEMALQLEDHLEPEEIFSALHTIGCALCLIEQWDSAVKVLDKALEKLRVTKMDNAAKASAVGQLVPLMKQAKKMREEIKDVFNEDVRPDVGTCDQSDDLPNVTYGLNPAIPAASSAVKFSFSPEKGRHLVAIRDIAAGDVVIVEEPFAWTTQNAAALKTNCLHCLKRTMAPIPCINCSTVCYCSLKCREESWERYHRFECSILSHFYDTCELSGMALLAYRTVCSATLQSLSSVSDSPIVPTSINPFLTKDYSTVFWQESHSNERLTEDLLKRTVTSIFLLRCLQKVGFLPSPLSITEDPSEEELLVGSALLRHLQSCSCNAYEITETLTGGGRGVRHSEPFELGGAVYPTISLLNHSCYANLARHSVNGKFCVVRASRNIQSNEELLDNYGAYFVTMPLDERLKILERQYFFRCCCIACSEEWETFDKLKATRYKCASCTNELGTSLSQIKSCPHCKKGDFLKVKKRLQQLSKGYSDALQTLLEGDAKKALEGVLEYYQELDKHVLNPCREVIKCQQAMNQCWSLLGNTD